MRLVLFVLYYGLAVLLGFILRGRFDQWMYAKPHMQESLVRYASEVIHAVEHGADEVPPPPLTVDADAFSPVVLQGPLGRVARAPDAAAGEPAGALDVAPEPGSADARPPVPEGGVPGAADGRSQHVGAGPPAAGAGPAPRARVAPGAIDPGADTDAAASGGGPAPIRPE